eukprot:12018217-Prorocentrum_lima.AAC.1
MSAPPPVPKKADSGGGGTAAANAEGEAVSQSGCSGAAAALDTVYRTQRRSCRPRFGYSSRDAATAN